MKPMNVKLNEVHIGLTDNCNFGCDYCFGGKARNSNLDLNQGKQVIEIVTAHAYKTVNITFFGGEPLLRLELLKEITAYARKQERENCSFNFGLVTNGSLLNDAAIAFLKENKFSILLSFDGVKEAQDRHRRFGNGDSSFMTVLDSIEKLLDSGLPFTIRPTVTPDNLQYLSESMAFCLRLGVKRIAFDLAYESGWTRSAMRLLEGQMKRVADCYLDFVKPNLEDIIIYPFHDTLVSRIKGVKQPRCGGGRESLYVAPDGAILFCCWFRGAEAKESFATVGDLRQGLDTRRLAAINAAIDENVNCGFACPSCDYQDLCNKYCLAHNYLCTGDPFKVAPAVCAYEKIRIAAALNLGERLYRQGHPYLLNMIGNLLFK